jgi:hypothetical protein
MKKRLLLPTLFSAMLLSASASAVPEKEVVIDSVRFASLTATEQARVLDLKARLETVMATDRSAMDRSERKALRSDWRALKEEMADVNRGGTVVYISTAGLIIIILLLIIIL